MTEDQLSAFLSEIVKRRVAWEEDIERLVVRHVYGNVELEWRDSGVGEAYVLKALQTEWPEIRMEIEVEGGCDSCGYGRCLTLTMYCLTAPWESL